MSPENINILAAKAKQNDKAMNELINALMPSLVKNAAATYIKGYDMDDLIQHGILSIIYAVKSYDSEKNSNFLPYALRVIKNNYNYLIRKICRTNYEASLNKVNEEGFELIELIKDPFSLEDDFIKNDTINELKTALKNLKPLDSDLLYELYFNNISVKKYAKKHNLIYVTCLRRKNRALNQLKKELSKK